MGKEIDVRGPRDTWEELAPGPKIPRQGAGVLELLEQLAPTIMPPFVSAQLTPDHKKIRLVGTHRTEFFALTQRVVVEGVWRERFCYQVLTLVERARRPSRVEVLSGSFDEIIHYQGLCATVLDLFEPNGDRVRQLHFGHFLDKIFHDLELAERRFLLEAK